MGKVAEGGNKGLAKLFGALLKVSYCWIPLREFLIWAKCPRRGGVLVLGLPKFLEQFMGISDHFLKVLDLTSVFKGIFRGQQYDILRCFVAFFKILRFTHKSAPKNCPK